MDSKVEAIRALVPLGLMHVAELLDDEVTELAGATVSRKFIQASATTLRKFQERDLSGEDVVALFAGNVANGTSARTW